MTIFSGESPADLCDAVYYSDRRPRPNTRFRAGDSVFCKIEQVPKLFERLRMSRRRVILVSGESDLPCDERLQRFLPPQVAFWFSTNVTSPHPRVAAIPLGIGRPGDPVTASEEDLRAAFRPPAERAGGLYVNFRPETNPAVRGPAFDHFRGLSRSGWVTFREPGACADRQAFLGEMTAHRFVLCPPGNGVDTHRFWETLVTGGIPVALRSPATEPFARLPIVLVDDFQQVTKPLLDAEWDRIAPHWVVPPETGVAFWKNRVREAQDAITGKSRLSPPSFLYESLAYLAGMVRRRLRL